ncbi:MAG: tetratricopeptide repeat protein [Kofleriaceae bacterium]|nr:tetratricopeptide repeat protein [Kofleriaceae bacterium]
MRSLVVLTVVLASHGLANAQGAEGTGDAQSAAAPQASEDHLKADQLFADASKLKAEGKLPQACAKYNEALSYNKTAIGTLLNVALCHEEAGRVATALEIFTQARDLARENNRPEHLAAAEEHITKNEAQVPHVAIAFAELLPNTKLVIDDKVYPITSASDIRVDPGLRHVVVTAPGRLPYDTSIEVKAQEHKAIAIPKLAMPTTVVNKGRVTVGKIVTFSGIAVGGTGIALGLIARSRYNAQVGPAGSGKNCTDAGDGRKPMCNAEGFQKTGNALQLGNVGTVVGIAGGAVVLVGAYLWFFAPKEKAHAERQVSIVPTLDPDGAGIVAVGRF